MVSLRLDLADILVNWLTATENPMSEATIPMIEIILTAVLSLKPNTGDNLTCIQTDKVMHLP